MNTIKTIKQGEISRETYGCEIGVTVEEWINILSDKELTTPNYKDVLLAFYNAPDHKATCKGLSIKEYGDSSQSMKYNSLIVHFGKAVIKRLNRFTIQQTDCDEPSYWNVAMNPGVSLPDGFQWTLRKELVQAIEKLWIKKSFTWIPFYTELAKKLLPFKDNRKALVDFVYSINNKYVGFIKTKSGKHVSDIDPFTVIGIFNRGLTDENRLLLADYFKKNLKLESSTPSDFDGIPILMSQNSMFFDPEKEETDIQPLWDFFTAAMNGERDKLSRSFDIVRKQKNIKWNITMALFWIQPYEFISLDSCNQAYLPKIGINVFKERYLNSEHYFKLLNEVKEKIENGEIAERNIPEISYRAWGATTGQEPKTETQPNVITDMEKSKYMKYIELLRANKNLVLTGAPGTGKTYMAHAIADDMNAEKEFVQFHPSYDYTDFVEGLRPVDNSNGQIGFERIDGVFKKFCRKALRNLEDSKKSAEVLKKEQTWLEKLQNFADESIESGHLYKLTNGSEFSITNITEHTITVHNENNEKTSDVTVSIDDVLSLLNNDVTLNNVHDIKRFFNRKYGTQPDSYAFVIVNKLRSNKQMKNLFDEPSVNTSTISRKDYVFIIDEINRGEVSKIFGELFFAIDPGYRGDSCRRVNTQYQNLVPDSDAFASGFYVPENVYIIATMNDIDRSVESMDFAIRRRFIWKEITPSDTAGMLDVLNAELAAEARKRMNDLNGAIADTDGLGSAYMIGPAYFLKLSENGGDFNKLWKLNIEPLLKEYLRGWRKSEDIMKKFEDTYMGRQSATEESTITLE